MQRLQPLDLLVLVLYLLAVAALGLAFARRSRDPAGFKIASGRLAGWTVGLSLFGTFLSSNTFLGVPGKAFGADWNSYVFSLTLPLAAFVAVRWFLPFHRRGASISAYAHFATRFGRWAQLYAVACYLLTQIARVGSILFGVSLGLHHLTAWPPAGIILVVGVLVSVYTWVGGIEAVIWTDVAQSVVLSVGALWVLAVVLGDIPGGFGSVLEQGAAAGKTSLGSLSLDLGSSTFWVVLAYGLCINLTNFGIDQSYVQRYHAARSEREASRSVWMAAWLYLPVSLVFFVLGTSLWVWSQSRPALSDDLRAEFAAERNVAVAVVTDADIGDRVLPRFLATELPVGVRGLLLAALLAAAMSSIDTSLNSSATVLEEDVLRSSGTSPPEQLRVLRLATLCMGSVGIVTALAMMRVQSILDAWWTLSGIFAGGLLGLFLLGFVVLRAGSFDAAMGVVVGTLGIGWMTLSPQLPEAWLSTASPLRSGLHSQLITVVGTLLVFWVGAVASRLRRD